MRLAVGGMALAAGALLTGCAAANPAARRGSAPSLRLDNPTGNRCFVDGLSTTASVLPFRYYGTTRIDAQPADLGSRPDWDHLPTSHTVEVTPPASPWLFPFDLVVEVARRTFGGTDDATVAVTVDPAPPSARIATGAQPPLVEFTERALQARASR